MYTCLGQRNSASLTIAIESYDQICNKNLYWQFPPSWGPMRVPLFIQRQHEESHAQQHYEVLAARFVELGLDCASMEERLTVAMLIPSPSHAASTTRNELFWSLWSSIEWQPLQPCCQSSLRPRTLCSCHVQAHFTKKPQRTLCMQHCHGIVSTYFLVP